MPTDSGTVTATAVVSAAEKIADSGRDVWTCVPYQSVEGAVNRGTATNSGVNTAYPVVTITGPGTNPGLVNETTGDEMLWQVPGEPLVLLAGDTLVADCKTHRAKLNGSASPYPSGWLTLQPGANTIACRFAAADVGAGASIDLAWDDAWDL